MLHVSMTNFPLNAPYVCGCEYEFMKKGEAQQESPSYTYSTQTGEVHCVCKCGVSLLFWLG